MVFNRFSMILPSSNQPNSGFSGAPGFQRQVCGRCGSWPRAAPRCRPWWHGRILERCAAQKPFWLMIVGDDTTVPNILGIITIQERGLYNITIGDTIGDYQYIGDTK